MPNVVDDAYALGAGGDVLAVTDYTEYPAEASSKRSIGLPMIPSVEKIVALHADLVLGEGNLNQAETVEELQRVGIPVFLVAPHGTEGIYHSLASLGIALDQADSAPVLIAQLRASEAAVRRRVSGKPVISVLVPIWFNPITTIGKHDFITELIEIAGGHSVTRELQQGWPQVSLEAVMAWAPQGLLLVQGSKMSAAQIRGLPGWSALLAVRNGRYFTVDDRIKSPSPAAIDALEQLAQQFHP